MRVLAIASHPGSGGAELTFAAFLRNRPADVDADVVVLGDGPLVRELERDGQRPDAALGYEGRPSAASVARFTRYLTRTLRERDPDVIWAMGLKAALLAAPAAKLARTPVVWHKVDFSYERSLARPVAAAVTGVIGVSEAVTGGLGGLRGRVLGVVWPPVSLPADLRRARAPETPAIGMLARLVPYKGQHLLVEAAGLLSREFPGLRVVLAGEDADPASGYRASLASLAIDLGISEAVEIPGFVDPVGLLPRLSVVVNATHRDVAGYGVEGLSGAMLEAGWAGVPVVATRGGGTAEGLIDGTTGILVERPDPGILALAIARFLRDPELSERVGRAGAKFVRARCTPEAASRRLFSLIATVA